MLVRILATVVLFFSVLYLPFWVSVILALGAMAYFRMYWEAVLVFLVIDALYGVPQERFFGFTFVASAFALALLLIVEILKTKTKFYN